MFGLRPYLKFIAPAVVTVVAAIITGVLTGNWNMLEMEIMVVGLLGATLSFILTNSSRGVKRYAKALGPALVTLLGFGVHYLFTQEWDRTEMAGVLTGLLVSFVALIVPNQPEVIQNTTYRAP